MEEQRSARCPGCGTFTWEWERDPDAYEVELFRCEGCAKKEGAAHIIVRSADPPATKYGIRPLLVRR